MIQKKLIGPFKQLLTMKNIPVKGPVSDDDLEIIENAGILIKSDYIEEVGKFADLATKAESEDYQIEELSGELVAMPGFIDPHTHICWAGSRARDYSLRLSGKSYIEIAKAGGGIWDTVTKTRNAFINDLTKITVDHAERMVLDGVTTIEVKSGYGLTIEDELKMLQAIKNADRRVVADLIPTCLAAHICPKDFEGTPKQYLDKMASELLSKVINKGLANRVDIFIEESAFNTKDALEYLLKAQGMGFEIAVHSDQFTTGGSKVAIEADAVSADHLEASTDEEIKMLAESSTIPVALPGASLGLGEPFTPARKLLDAGASLAIGSDWNPGSAPMGDLLVQAAILGVFEKLTCAETLAGITVRAAAALDLKDRGTFANGNQADIVAFKFNDYREILYNQGKIKPSKVWKKGIKVK